MDIEQTLKGWSELLGASGGNIPTNTQAFLYGIMLGETSAQAYASEYVRDWANPLDSLHEAHLKGILNEIADGIDGQF